MWGITHDYYTVRILEQTEKGHEISFSEELSEVLEIWLIAC